MSINLGALNLSEGYLAPSDNQTNTYRVSTEQLKKDWADMKSQSRDLFQLSGQSADAMSKLNVSGQVTRISNYSLDAFFQKDMPSIANKDGSYTIGGATFSKSELEQCRAVMKAAADGIEAGPGKNLNLDYRNYAQMGIAVSSVQSYAASNLTEEQAKVVNKAMQEYNQSLISMEKEYLSEDDYPVSDTNDFSKYYGMKHVLTDGELKAINEMKKELSKITGHAYKPVEKGYTVTIQSATNQKLIQDITDLFSNMDINDETSVSKAMEQYKKLAGAAYKASGLSGNSLNSVLNQDIAGFRNQIKNSNLAANYRSFDQEI